MTKYYLNKWNGMIYWVQDEDVMFDNEDMCDPTYSSFTLEEFESALFDEDPFEEISLNITKEL